MLVHTLVCWVKLVSYLSLYVAGERIEMGGIVDPVRGTLIYRETTEFETVEPEVGSEFTKKKIKKVTSESSWIGQGPVKKAPAVVVEMPPVPAVVPGQEVNPWHDEEVESNPLYSASEYVSDFQNPLYSRQSVAEGEELLVEGGGETGTNDDIPLLPIQDNSRAARDRPESTSATTDDYDYSDYLQPEGDVDTLF